jgi:hypothetical protein
LSSVNIADHAVLIKGAREFGFEQIVMPLREKTYDLLEINLNNLVNNRTTSGPVNTGTNYVMV